MLLNLDWAIPKLTSLLVWPQSDHGLLLEDSYYLAIYIYIYIYIYITISNTAIWTNWLLCSVLCADFGKRTQNIKCSMIWLNNMASRLFQLSLVETRISERICTLFYWRRKQIFPLSEELQAISFICMNPVIFEQSLETPNYAYTRYLDHNKLESL